MLDYWVPPVQPLTVVDGPLILRCKSIFSSCGLSLHNHPGWSADDELLTGNFSNTVLLNAMTPSLPKFGNMTHLQLTERQMCERVCVFVCMCVFVCERDSEREGGAKKSLLVLEETTMETLKLCISQDSRKDIYC